jgi:hypothetical protein
VLGARVAPDGTLLDTDTINGSTDDQVGPRLAFDGDNYLATWSDRRAGPDQVYYTRVTADGTPLEPDGRRLLPQDSALAQLAPMPASNGSGFLVAWLAAGAGYVVSAARLGSDGEPLDSTAIRLTPDSVFQWSVAAGTGGEDYVVVWSGEVPSSDSNELCLARVSAGGEILDSVPVTLVRSRADIADVAVAYLDGTYLVTWTDWRADADIYACRVLQDGTVLDSGGFAVCPSPAIQYQPAVAAGTDRFVVCWSEFCDSTYDVYAVGVDLEGHIGMGAGRSAKMTRRALLRAVPSPARGSVRFGPCGIQPIRIFDCHGGLVRVLEGSAWDGLDRTGRLAAAGTYVAVSGRASCAFLLLR